MTTWYEFKGSLEFATAAEAKAALGQLRAATGSVFWTPPEHEGTDLVVDGAKLLFDDGNFTGGESFYSACSHLEKLLAQAIGGRVRVQDGDDGEPGTRVYWYAAKGKRPKKTATAKAPAKKSTKKTAGTKKPAAKTKKATKKR